ncbi:MAG TPA: transglutaminase domain-containing protein [Terriglobales bacterium]|nr:transglutaminase domain-containing protein [Terriglobales bacterium]
MRRAAALACLLAGWPVCASAETLVVQGRMSARVTVEIAERYEPAAGTEFVRLRSFRTPSFESPTWKQRVVADEVAYATPPSRPAETLTDDAGNRSVTEVWQRPSGTIELLRRIVVDMDAPLGSVESRAPFPVAPPAAEHARYLVATKMVQVQDSRIQELSRRLTANARTQREAVTAIMDFVVDRLTWKLEPPGHDALTGLTGGVVNCQGYSHLSLALLRAAGIPSRIAVGITLSKGWRVSNVQGSSIVFKMGTGRHAWVEVFYPDLGWVPYDPQNSHLFVSLYHVRQAVGRDVEDVYTTTSAAPALPRIQQVIQGDGAGERFALTTVTQRATPRNLVITSDIRDGVAAAPPPPPPPVKPPPPVVTPPARHEMTQAVEFGHLDFPASLRIFSTGRAAGGGVEARSAFFLETADYATGAEELAQAFTVERPILLTDVALALQKFGGRQGDLWLDFYEDRDRKPGRKLGESQRLSVGTLVDRAGYRWTVFPFAPAQGGVMLPRGRYWVVLRSQGDGIFNWWFGLGNAYGEPDDSRVRPRGAGDWSTVLNYRFNFRVSGLVKP